MPGDSFVHLGGAWVQGCREGPEVGGGALRSDRQMGLGSGRDASISASAGGEVGSRASVVELAGVVASAFQRVDPRGPFGRSARRGIALVALVLYERRVHETGRALCLVNARWGRVIAITGCFVVCVGVLGLVSEVAAMACLIALACTLAPLGVGGARALPAQARLSGQTPAGRHKYVHSLASVERGAGAELLGALCDEADLKHWSLVLDAGSSKLVSYYEMFGFRTCGRPIRMPNGQFHVRMFRAWRVDVVQRAQGSGQWGANEERLSENCP